MFSVEWILAIPAVFILYAVIKYFNSGGSAVPYPQAVENFKKELDRINSANLTTVQRDQSIDRLSTRPVRVDGVVKDVRRKSNYDSDLYLDVDVEGFGVVTCDLADQDSNTRARSLNKGQKVRLKGTIGQISIHHPTLYEAKFT